MSLNERLKTVILEGLEKIELYNLDFYARQNKEVIKFHYETGIIDDVSIEKTLELMVLREARFDYGLLTPDRRVWTKYADDLVNPEFFAYALTHGEFTESEIKNIPFDYRGNAEIFSKTHSKENLLSILRQEFLNPKPEYLLDNYDPSHTCATCH